MNEVILNKFVYLQNHDNNHYALRSVFSIDPLRIDIIEPHANDKHLDNLIETFDAHTDTYDKLGKVAQNYMGKIPKKEKDIPHYVQNIENLFQQFYFKDLPHRLIETGGIMKKTVESVTPNSPHYEKFSQLANSVKMASSAATKGFAKYALLSLSGIPIDPMSCNGSEPVPYTEDQVLEMHAEVAQGQLIELLNKPAVQKALQRAQQESFIGIITSLREMAATMTDMHDPKEAAKIREESEALEWEMRIKYNKE